MTKGREVRFSLKKAATRVVVITCAASVLAGTGMALQAMPVVEVPVITQVEEAEAHTGDVHADTQCINAGLQKQTTFTLTLGNVPPNTTVTKVETHTGPVNFPGGWNRGTFPDNEWVTRYTNLPTLTVPPWTTPAFPGSTTGNGPWELVVTTFSNDVVVLSDTRAENMTACKLKDASATVTIDQNEGCLNNTSVQFTLANATWDGPADLTVGTHTRNATSTSGHFFADGTSHASVTYTIKAADPALCPNDADATVSTDQQETCLDGSTVKFDLAHASWDGPADTSVGTHTRSATADSGHFFANGTSHMTVTYTVKAADPALCPKDASASVDVDQQETCLTGSTVKANLMHATLDGPIDTSVGTHSIGATADTNHLFGDGSTHITLSYTIKAADPSLCPKDASASASVDQQEGCLTDSTALFTLAHASWETAADTTVGTHDRWAAADTGFLFPDGSQRLKVTYTITAANPLLCPQDANASVSADTKESCSGKSTVKFALANATWDGPGDTSVGTHTRTATADVGHLFANGTQHMSVTYTIKAQQTGDKLCPPLLALTGQGLVGLIIAIVLFGVGTPLLVSSVRRSRRRQALEANIPAA